MYRLSSCGAAALMALASVAAGSCSSDDSSTTVYSLDRPTEITFACYGDLRITNGEPAAADQPLVISAQPVESCRLRYRDQTPAGQENDDALGPDLAEPLFAGFVLQPSSGTVALITFPATPSGISTAAVNDGDPLTPGFNAIPIGTLPVGITTDPAGCHLITANAGSCDLSILDINSALDDSVPSRIDRVAIENQDGVPVLARPGALVAGEPGMTEVGDYCPEQPHGLLYVAYPRCHAVAAVEPDSGQLVAAIRFAADGTVTLSDGDLTCPAECGDGTTADDPIPDAPRPGALELAEDGSRLYVGADNSPSITVVDLGDDHLPTAVRSIPLEGDIGITALAVSPAVDMGGDFGLFGLGDAGRFRFVYAVATDKTVRVAEVDNLNYECDTQVDPRYLHDVTDVTWLSCLPAGSPTTPPRRFDESSPGITLPSGAAPLDVAFATVDNDGEQFDEEPAGTAMLGVFAFVTSSNGYAFVVTVDDDNYPDFEDPDDPAAVFLPLAMAHQLRDFGTSRDAVDGLDEDGTDTSKCVYPDDYASNEAGPRLEDDPVTSIDTDYLSTGKMHLLPSMRSELCVDNDELESAVPELSFAAALDTRERDYPDLATTVDEGWYLTWEGALSIDGLYDDIDGPVIRLGYFDLDDGFALLDPSHSFCATGVQPYDIAVLLGCDPDQGECGLGETCYVHPDSPTTITTGMCLPVDQVDALSGTCKDVLTSRRRYTILETDADQLVLGERRYVLSTTPVDGCESAEQCAEMADLARSLVDSDHPVDVDLDPPDPERSWVCEPDPSRAPGPDRCQMACQSSDDCEDGWACSNQRCVDGPVPPAACVATQQRYQLRVGDAFAVIGTVTGFLHNRIVDPDTGACIDDPDGNPLRVGRLPLDAPPCQGDGFTDLSPNPCSTTVEEVESYTPYAFEDGECVAMDDALRTRTAPAIRFENPAWRFHLVDPTTTGDAHCIGDRAGTWPRFRAVHPGFQLRFAITGGDFPLYVTDMTVAFPETITAGPEGGLWILDQGDVSSTASTEGRVVHINPSEGDSSFGIITLR